MLLRGTCRHCGVRISPAYPLVETVTAFLVVTCVALYGLTAEAALAAGFCSVLVVLSVIDMNHRIVPNRIVLPAAGVTLVAHTALEPSPAWLAWALIASGALFLVVLAYPKGLGMGDVKLMLLLGAMLGASVTVAFMIGLFASLVPAAFLVSRHGTSARKMGVPLVPFLVARRRARPLLRRRDARRIPGALLRVVTSRGSRRLPITPSRERR